MSPLHRFLLLGAACLVGFYWGSIGPILGVILAEVTFFRLLILIILFLPIYLLILKIADFVRFRRLEAWKNVQPPNAESAGAPAETIAEVRDLLRKQGSSAVDWEKVLPAIDTICDLYLNATEEIRAEIRQSFRGVSGILLKYTRLSGFKVRQRLDGSERYLVFRRAVAAAIIENLQQEWRDTHVALSGLSKAAKLPDHRPWQILEEMAAIASPANAFPSSKEDLSMQTFLVNLARHVRRELGD